MRGVLIFNQLNDVLFTKCDKEFADHIRKLAEMQGLLENEDTKDSTPSPNVMMQLFSPIVTSQRVMTSQFGNSYTSMKCQDGTNMVFDEYIGYTFVYIATEEIELMRRTAGVCVSIVRHVCGPDIMVLRTNRQKACLVSSLLDAWCHLRDNEQSVLTEAVEQLSVNSEVASSILKVLHDACDKLRTQFANLHMLILVGAKFLSLYSSKHAHDLCASDILLIILLCWVVNNKRNDRSEEQPHCRNEKTKPTFGAKLANPTSEDITDLFGGSRESSIIEGLSSLSDDGLYSQSLLLGGQHDHTANAVHVFELSDSVHLITIVESTNVATSSGLCDSFRYLNLASSLQLQRDLDELKSAVDNLDTAIKKLLEGIRKNRSNIGNDVDMCQKRLQTKWDFLRRKYGDLLRTRDPEAVLQIEANTSGLAETLRELLRLTCFDRNFLKHGLDVLTTVGRLVRQKLNDFNDFLKVKALKNFTLGSYLEEFPGLVHFIYIDRTTHRLVAPTLDFTSPETLALTTKKIWDMVEQSRIHLQEGHLSVMWKDTIFNYSYFLWFEDSSGWSPPKCKVYLNHVMKNFPVPGILCGDYYRKLTETCFPKVSPSKVRIHELYCVHLGLATSTCVLEHSRRLAATIWEVIGVPSNLADIF
ncbi:PREDICTED: Hermansky-Pudlak syndrome 1 protein homolog isoform X2 [Dinoponera quadriceps]|uniref:Hermansky-Pudlak syndrome 1 protein homolog isoform X2 n=1 Tax=Dinoponera quadriceps TaxID=609295 RepID=A0A6P3Y9E5_DINQU|nr:PREDICTED: Hermansky-Pudlak syndrome 1 protein homolog isoform X2 [Dinoponera quadriceps]